MTVSKHRTIHNNETLDYTKTAKTISLYHKKMKNTEAYKIRNKKISEKIKEHNRNVFNQLSEEKKLEKLNKKEQLLQHIKEIEEYFHVDYSKLSKKEKNSYGVKLSRIKNPEIIKNKGTIKVPFLLYFLRTDFLN